MSAKTLNFSLHTCTSTSHEFFGVIAEGGYVMPIYEYRCQDCDHEFERMQKFSDPPIANCPTCAGPVRKLISRSAFHLKGDGWYVTDYARKGNSQNQNGKSSPDNRSTTGDSSSKPGTTSEDKGSSTSKGTSTDASTSAPSAVDTTSSS
jgi:putative FmdB family regulatory protein